MGEIRLFHVIWDGAHELENNPFPYERGLQDLFEKHLRALTGVDFLGSEYSTGQRHSRRIDTLGIDEAGRPVVIELKTLVESLGRVRTDAFKSEMSFKCLAVLRIP